ncbi:MAG TPA: TRAP transporter substrate-binding protein DctP, partial [Clostridiaceae bacterium]|nr:TRAP transporter substrate-binding protein DctP [Clostridiaceae bacterium]
LLHEKALEACEWGRDMVEESEEKLKVKFRDAGVEVTELTSEELEPFKAVVSDLRMHFKEKYGTEAAEAFGLK